MARARRLVVGLVVALLALLAATPASALPRTISWASPHGAGGPFAGTTGVELVSSNAASEVCGVRREQINPNLQSIVTASTPDGSKVFFTTTDKLDAVDTDAQKRDIYEFSGGQTKLVSDGIPLGDHAYFMACSTDGSRVFFGSTALLFLELWERSGGGTTQVNVGPTAGTNNSSAGRVAISADGTKVVFDTLESLTADDADSPAASDVFERSGGTTKLVSKPGTQEVGTTLAGVSADGNTIYMDSSDQLAAEDTNAGSDVYAAQSLGNPTVVSLDPVSGLAAGGSSFFRGATPSGGHVFFTTATGIDATDTDAASDIYDRNGSATTWISKPDPGRPNDNFPTFSATSPDGGLVYFSSDAALKATDTDDAYDLYLRTTTGLVHITQQVAGADFSVVGECSELGVTRGCVSTDGTKYFFSTQERLLPSDTDTNGDIYRFTAPAGPLQLVSGTGTSENRLGGVSENGTRAVFDTADRLVSCLDNDNGASDVYEWDNGTLNLVTPPLGTSEQGNVFASMSADGATVFFASNAQYAGSGNDGFVLDLFAARPGGAAAVCPGAPKPVPKPLAKDVTAPTAALSGAKTQKAGKSVSVTVACDEACVASASGTVSVPGAAKVFKLGKAKKKSIRAGGKAKLKLKVSKKARRAIRKALRNKRKVRATIKLRVADTLGNATRPTRKIRLRK